MIAVRDLSIVQGAFALDGVSFTVPTGQYGVLMGRTGSGKTTILEAVCGLRPVRGGVVELMGRDVTHLKPAERGVGYVPQDRALFPTMTVRQHLAFAPLVHGWGRPEIDDRVEELARLLGIGYLLGRYPIGLSGGEAQRVALGRALAMRPGVLLLDEPLSALDEETRGDMFDLLRQVRAQTQVTVLHITHSRDEAQRLADCILLVHQGKVTAIPDVVKAEPSTPSSTQFTTGPSA